MRTGLIQLKILNGEKAINFGSIYENVAQKQLIDQLWVADTDNIFLFLVQFCVNLLLQFLQVPAAAFVFQEKVGTYSSGKAAVKIQIWITK